MKALELEHIEKDYFDHREIARALNIKPESARVLANRYVKNNILLRPKRDLYILRSRWQQFDRRKRFEIANLLQVPSYISLTTALEYYEVTTQMQSGFIESIALKRTKEIYIETTLFNYIRIKENLYSGFARAENVFMASAEKALLDAVYLMSFGRYRLDISAIDFGKLNRSILQGESKKFPGQTQHWLKKYGFI